MMLVGCSSGDPLAVQLSHDQGPGDQPFTASGIAVDEGVICSSGTMTSVRLESLEGDQITEGDWADMFDGAMEAGGVAEMNVTQEWTCSDASGSFTIMHHNRFDFATFEFGGQQDVGSWEIIGGSDSYSDLAGAGDVILDLDAEKVLHDGDVE